MQQFTYFIDNNWLALLSILIGIIVTYGVSSFFYRLQKKSVYSASQERKKHALNELLDVIESYIINKQNLSDRVIDNLIFASERDHTVQLRPACTAISLLQDVELRLQRSRHLDIPQKSEYSLKIEGLINDIMNRSDLAQIEPLTSEIRNTLMEIEGFVPEENREKVKKSLASLAILYKRERELSSKRIGMSESIRILTTFFSITVGIIAAFAANFVGSQSEKTTFFSTHDWAALWGVILGISTLIIGIYIFLQRPSQEIYPFRHHDEN